MKREAISERLGDVSLCPGDGLSGERGDVDQAIVELKRACLDLDDFEQAICQPLQALARLLDHLEKLVLFLWGKLLASVQKCRRIPVDHRQRRAKLMTNGGQKLDKQAFGLLERGLWRSRRGARWGSLTWEHAHRLHHPSSSALPVPLVLIGSAHIVLFPGLPSDQSCKGDQLIATLCRKRLRSITNMLACHTIPSQKWPGVC